MGEFKGILFTLKKRMHYIRKNDTEYYKYMILGYYDGLDIHTVEKWYDFRPKGLMDRSLQVDMKMPFIDQYTIRTFLPQNHEQLDKEGFAYSFWQKAGCVSKEEFKNYEPEIRRSYPFVCMFSMHLTEKYVEGKKDLRDIQSGIIDLLKKSAGQRNYTLSELHCALFPSAGYSDFILLFLTDDLKKPSDIINGMRGNVSENDTAVISSCYSICGLDLIYFDSDFAYRNHNTHVTIRINLQEGVSAAGFLGALERENEKQADLDFLSKEFVDDLKENLFETFGNSDCLLLPEQPIDKYLRLHAPGKILNPGSEFFGKYISNVRTSIRIKEDCLGNSVSVGAESKDISVFEDRFEKFIEQYEKFLNKNDMHIRSSRAIQQIMKIFLNTAHSSHGFDVETVLGDAFICLFESMEYFMGLQKEEIADSMSDEEKYAAERRNSDIAEQWNLSVAALEEFKEHIGNFMLDLIRSDRPFMEGNALMHSSIGSAAKFLFAYSRMLKELTKKHGKEGMFAFVVTSGGCDRTQIVDPFSFVDNNPEVRKPLIIKISEMSVYDIQGTLFRILHEYFHFIGERQRKKRFQHLINALANGIAYDMCVYEFSKRRLNFFEYYVGQYLSENRRQELFPLMESEYSFLRNKTIQDLSDAIRNHPEFVNYRNTHEDDEAYYAKRICQSVLDPYSIVAIYQGPDDYCLLDKMYDIFEKGDNEFVRFISRKLNEMMDAAVVEEDRTRALLAMDHVRLLSYGNHEFRKKYPEERSKSTEGFIRRYFFSLLGNIPMADEEKILADRENDTYIFSELCTMVLTAMRESYSDCMAICTLDMKKEDFLLSFIYELWDANDAFPLTGDNILRIGADLQVMYGVYGELNSAVTDAIHNKAKQRGEQAYSYRGVDKMISRINEILQEYQDPALSGIRSELELYLKECIGKREDWYSKEWGILYQNCEMDTSDKLYQALDNIVCQWKNLSNGS